MSLPTIPGFEILSLLGAGTTGVVYDARDARIDRRVALKVLRRDPATEDFDPRKQFIFESRVLAKLSGPGMHLPPLHLVDDHDGQLYYARELVDGSTLLEQCAKGLINFASALKVLVEVAGVVQQVHAQRLVHRNLSVENVLVAKDGTAWLIGFGRVRRLHEARLSPSEPAFGAVVEVDIRGLQRMLTWMCEALHVPLTRGLDDVLQPDSVGNAMEFAEALAVCIPQIQNDG